MDKSYILMFNDGNETWATQYDSLYDIRHDLIGRFIVDYDRIYRLLNGDDIYIMGMTVKLIIANKYKRRDL